MENTQTTDVAALIAQAKGKLADDMKEREIGAILWNNSTAGFHYIPEIVINDGKESKTVRIMGLYNYEGKLYAVEEGTAPAHLTNFYTEGIEVPPVVVTLSEDLAVKELGIPLEKNGYTTQGSSEEWLVIADCYFEALNEK